MKRIYLRGSAALLSALLFGQLMQPGLALAASSTGDGVAINAENFPDQAFRTWLTDRANLGGAGSDSFLSAEELAAIRQINVSGQSISSLKGIELFPALQQLSCKNNTLTELDVSRNKELTYLQCSTNKIHSLDVSGLEHLVALYCEDNHMTELKLTGATALEIIYCRNNDLPSVDFSTNTKLKFIESFDNNLTKVDLSMLKSLEFVHLDHNLLTTLDLSQNTSLSPIGSGFVARNNHLDTLTLPNKPDLMVDPDVYFEQDPKLGYERVEWYSDPDHSNKIDGPVQAQGQTLYAKWLPNKYNIYFSSNGGRGTMDSQPGLWDQELTLSANQFSRVGYTFHNWKNTFGDGKTYTDQQKITNLAGDYQGQKVTLYAQWTPNTYTVKFDPTDGTGSLDDLSCTYDQSKALTSAATLHAPEGLEFAGWATQKGGAVRYRDGDTVRNLTGDAGGEVTLYAVWRKPVSGQYLESLETAFSKYHAENYTAQDWEKLTQFYTNAAGTIPGAGGEEAMGNLRDQAVTGMAEIATLADRAGQAVSAWKNAHSVTQQANRNAVDEGNAADLRQDVQDALAGLSTEQVASATGLTQPADQERVLALALEKTQSDFQALNALEAAAAWAEGLGGLSTRATREVTPDWLSAYTSALNAADEHKANLSNPLLSALETRRDLARQKSEALV